MTRAIDWKPWQDFRPEPGDGVVVHGSEAGILAVQDLDEAMVLPWAEAVAPLGLGALPVGWPDWLWPVRWPDGGVVVVDEATVEVVRRAGPCAVCSTTTALRYREGTLVQSLCDACEPKDKAAKTALKADSLEDRALNGAVKAMFQGSGAGLVGFFIAKALQKASPGAFAPLPPLSRKRKRR